MQASALNNIAGIYLSKGELDKALDYYEESLRLQTDEKKRLPLTTILLLSIVKKAIIKRLWNTSKRR
jgi:tetratricopeptide (TPR) repeat protein